MDYYYHCITGVSNFHFQPETNLGLSYDMDEDGLRVCHTHNKGQNILLYICVYIFALLAFINILFCFVLFLFLMVGSTSTLTLLLSNFMVNHT